MKNYITKLNNLYQKRYKRGIKLKCINCNTIKNGSYIYDFIVDDAYYSVIDVENLYDAKNKLSYLLFKENVILQKEKQEIIETKINKQLFDEYRIIKSKLKENQ